MKGKLLRKVASVSVAASMVMLTAGPVLGQTIEDLMAQIAALQAQLVALQGGGAAYNFTRDLYQGLSGADVTALQNYLKTGGYFTATATGSFGPITKAAVAAWQAANGVSPAAGYFGAVSRAKYNMLVAAAPAASPAASPVAELEGAEGDIVDFEVLGTPSAEDANEGDDDLKVLGVGFEADGSDLKLERVEVFVSRTTNAAGESYRPWDYFKDLSIWVDGDKVAEKDADSSGDWSENDDSDDAGASKDYKMTFTGIDTVIDDGDEANVYVALSVKDNIDTEDETTDFTVWIPVDGIRAMDAAGINQYAPDAVARQNFFMAAVTAGALTISYDEDENEARVLDVDDINDTNGAEVLAFALEADDGDVLVTDLSVDYVGAGITDINTALKRLHLYKGGSLVKSEAVPDDVDAAGTVVFDDIDITIDEDSKDSFTVKADWEDTGADFADGDSVAFDIDAADVVAEDVTGDAVAPGGNAVGGAIAGFDNGIKLALVSRSASRTFVADAAGELDQATYVIKFNVTAFGAAAFVANGADEADAPAAVPQAFGASYDLIATANEAGIDGTTIESLTSTANEDLVNNNFEVPDGQTKEFTLTVTATANTGDAYARIGLEGVYWGVADDANGEILYNYGLDSDWQTDDVFLNVF